MNNLSASMKKFLGNKNTVTIIGVVLCLILLYWGYNYRINQYDKNIKTGFLYEDDDLGREIMSFGVAEYCRQLNANAAHPHRKLISEQEIIDLHNLGMSVNPWTVNKDEDILRLTKWGCDALITDVPDYCRRVLEAKYGKV